jgi:chitin synthase
LKGNEKSTPDLLVDMIDVDTSFIYPPPAYSYVAIADGQKRHNKAQVYAGKYAVDGHTCPIVIVVKCGNEEERRGPKPGNRGKRDSQIILMDFLRAVTFDERLSPLQFDMFTKMTAVANISGLPLDLQRDKVGVLYFNLSDFRSRRINTSWCSWLTPIPR